MPHSSETPVYTKLFYLVAFLLFSLTAIAQTRDGYIKGVIIDGSNNQPLFGVNVAVFSSGKSVISEPDGGYQLRLLPGSKKIQFRLQSFQTKLIEKVIVNEDAITELNIVLYPVGSRLIKEDSLKKDHSDSLVVSDTVITNDYVRERLVTEKKASLHAAGKWDALINKNNASEIDKNSVSFIKRLPGVVVNNISSLPGQPAFTINGLGERYNALSVDGAVLNSFSLYDKSYSLAALPVEVISGASVRKYYDASTTADFSGGLIAMKTIDFPVANFYYVKAGVNFYDKTLGEKFLSDKGNSGQFFGFPGSARDLPSEFPTTRSRFALSSKNIQEQIYLSRQLKNNLSPVDNGNSKPNTDFTFGAGKTFRYKNGNAFGITGYITQQKSEQIEDYNVQVLPDVINNPYPFIQGKALINAQSVNKSYSYQSQLNAVLNSAILFGKNKISFKGLFTNQFYNSFTQRSAVAKPDEDSLATASVNYKTEQRRLINLQLSGEHALGAKSKLKLSWLAAYSSYRQNNPDERNFLLRVNAANSNQFEIAHQAGVVNDVSNTSRTWRNLKEDNFTGSFTLTFPFNAFNVTNLLSGGVFVQTKYREFYSNVYNIRGNGYFSLDQILSSERYYPGGLSIQNYYTNAPGYLDLNDRANYTGSANLGASFIKMENKLSRKLNLNLGFRVESNSQLVSSTQYNYFEGFRNPQAITIDQNVTVNKFSLLPSLRLNYYLHKNFIIHTGYFKTVNRAQLEELSINRYFDALGFMIKTGNQLLRNSTIQNGDLTAEWHDGLNSVAASVFYKEIDQPIEYVLTAYSKSAMIATATNMPTATVKGINGSFNLNISSLINSRWLSGINIFADGVWSKANVKSGPLKSVQVPVTEEHSLSGSPSFMANGGLLIHYPKAPNLTVLYNYTGDYVLQVGSGTNYKLDNGLNVLAIPNYRVKGIGQLDIQLSHSVLNNSLQLAVGVNNLLNEKYIIYQDLNGNKKFDEPLIVNGKNGLYQSGVDNTVMQRQTQRGFYFTISYIFKKP